MRARNNRLGPNDPCPCGSGKKFKRCHGTREGMARMLVRPTYRVPLIRQPRSGLSAEIARRVLPNVAVVWIAPDVYRRSLTWDEAKQRLAQMNLESALLSLAMLNAVCAELMSGPPLNQPSGRPKVAALVLYLFPSAHQERAMQIYEKNHHNTFIGLAPQSCSAMTEACMRYCSRDGGTRFEQPHQCEDFGLLLLCFHEHLNDPSLTRSGLDFGNLSQDQFRTFARNYLAANLEKDLLRLFIRHHMMFEASARNDVIQRRLGMTAAQWFESITGVDPVLYRVLLLMSLYHGREFNIDGPDLRHLVYHLDMMLANLEAGPADAYRRLHDLSVADTTLAGAEPPDWDSAVYGAHYVRRRPVLHLDGDRFVCLHKQFLAERFFGGTVHVLTELADRYPPVGWPGSAQERRIKVRREMGYIFEDYGCLMVDTLVAGAGIERRFNIIRADGGECDALVVVNGTALAFEFVNHPWSLAERARGESENFIPHVADNIGKAGRLCRELVESGYIPETDVVVTRALPVVVMSEVLPVTEMMSPTFERDLVAAVGEQLVRGGGGVLPVQTLSITQVENIDRLDIPEGATGLADFLASRAQDPLQRFSGAPNFNRALGAARRLRPFEEATERSLHEVAPSLFREPIR